MNQTFWTIAVAMPMDEVGVACASLSPERLAREAACLLIRHAGVTLPATRPEILANADGYPVARWSWYE